MLCRRLPIFLFLALVINIGIPHRPTPVFGESTTDTTTDYTPVKTSSNITGIISAQFVTNNEILLTHESTKRYLWSVAEDTFIDTASFDVSTTANSNRSIRDIFASTIDTTLPQRNLDNKTDMKYFNARYSKLWRQRSPDGSVIAVESKDLKSLKILHAETWQELRAFVKPRRAWTRLMHFPKENALCVTADNDNLYVWNISTGELIGELNNLDEPSFAGFTDDYRYLIVGTGMSSVLWDYKQKQIIQSFGKSTFFKGSYLTTRAATISHDGKYLVTGIGLKVPNMVNPVSGWIDIWDIKTGDHLHKIKDVRCPFLLLFSPDDKFLLAIDWALAHAHFGFIGTQLTSYVVSTQYEIRIWKKKE